jgi:hypothetical protein
MSADADLLTISQIVARLPGSRGARRVHPATVTRWILTGCPARDGRRVKLAATRAGSRWLVREADLQAFFAALAADAVPPTPPRTCTFRLKSSERAARELERMGA